MPSVRVELQKTIFEALRDGLDVPVYDFVPEDAAFPYVTVRIGQVQDLSPSSKNAWVFVIELNIWSTYLGSKEVLDLGEKCQDLLHRTDLYVPGYKLIAVQFVDEFVLPDPQVEIFRTMQRYRAHVFS